MTPHFKENFVENQNKALSRITYSKKQANRRGKSFRTLCFSLKRISSKVFFKFENLMSLHCNYNFNYDSMSLHCKLSLSLRSICGI